MTAQELVDHFRQERLRFHSMRAAVDQDDGRAYLWDDVRAHIGAFLDRVDPKRQVITDWQLADAIPLGDLR